MSQVHAYPVSFVGVTGPSHDLRNRYAMNDCPYQIVGPDGLDEAAVESALKAILDFESKYAARSGVSVEQLRAAGRRVMLCDCGEAECSGWRMGYRSEE